jgi:septum site-determining protein MinC
MALILAPEPPLGEWLAALDAQIANAPGFFDQRPVVLDFGLLPQEQQDVAELIEAIAARGIRIIGTEAAHPSWPGVAKWGGGLGPPSGGRTGATTGRPVELPKEPPPSAAATVATTGVATGSTLLIDRPLRSGQTVMHEAGDVTVLGGVAWGAEIIARGSIHIYGALRGRAYAGLNGNKDARIFCRRLEAELVAIDGFYLTAEDMDQSLVGRPAQVWLEGESLRLAALD